MSNHRDGPHRIQKKSAFPSSKEGKKIANFQTLWEKAGKKGEQTGLKEPFRNIPGRLNLHNISFGSVLFDRLDSFHARSFGFVSLARGDDLSVGRDQPETEFALFILINLEFSGHWTLLKKYFYQMYRVTNYLSRNRHVSLRLS